MCVRFCDVFLWICLIYTTGINSISIISTINLRLHFVLLVGCCKKIIWCFWLIYRSSQHCFFNVFWWFLFCYLSKQINIYYKSNRRWIIRFLFFLLQINPELSWNKCQRYDIFFIFCSCWTCLNVFDFSLNFSFKSCCWSAYLNLYLLQPL